MAVALLLPSASPLPRHLGRSGRQQGRGGRGGKGGKGNRGQGSGGNKGGNRGEGEEVPAWCNPQDPMGAWMNYIKIREWCESNGFTEHGPYGGNSLEGSGGEEDY